LPPDLAAAYPTNWHRANEPRLSIKGFTSGITESQALYDLVRDQLIKRYALISVGWLNHDTPLIDSQPNALQQQNLIELGKSN